MIIHHGKRRFFGFACLAICMMVSLLGSLGVLPGLVGRQLNQPAVAQAAPSVSAPGIHLVKFGPEYLELEFVAPPYEVVQSSADQQVCQLLVAGGLSDPGQPGWPRLPMTGTLIGIPAQGEPRLEILESQTTVLPGNYRICPGLQPDLQVNLDGSVDNFGEIARFDPVGYQNNVFAPSAPVELEVKGLIRSQRVASVQFHPFQYNPVTQQILLTRSLRVRVHFPAFFSPESASSFGIPDEGAFEDTLRSSVINYGQARAWRLPHVTAIQPAETTKIYDEYHILLDQDGIYQLTYQYLKDAGIPVDTINPNTFLLRDTYRADITPLYLRGNADTVFQPGEALLFYGLKARSKYTDSRKYVLTWDDPNTFSMRIINVANPLPNTFSPRSFSTRLHIEENHIYQSTRPSGAGNDHWYWEGLKTSGTTASYIFRFDLNNIDFTVQNITLSGLLKGAYATPNHKIKLYLNGNLVHEAEWLAGADYEFEVSAPTAYLLEGENELKLDAIVDSSVTSQTLFTNWFEISYNRTYIASVDPFFFEGDTGRNYHYKIEGFTNDQIMIFDISPTNRPSYLAGIKIYPSGNTYTVEFDQSIEAEHHYIAVTAQTILQPNQIYYKYTEGLKSIWNAADYLVISHPNFIASLAPLVDYRSKQGLRTKIVDVNDVYHVFGNGILDPDAIQKFLAYAYANWKRPAPSYVLLVGDGNYDFKNYLNNNDTNFMPPFLGDLDPWLGETASDNRYVAVSGADNLPDMHIGRLPVRTPEQASALVQKILANENNHLLDKWYQKAMFVADNADSAGNFAYFSDQIADFFLPKPFVADKVYYLANYPDIPSTRIAILNGINEGRLLVSYIGHASVQWWAYEKILQKSDIKNMTNLNKYPFFMALTCLDGFFINPQAPGGDSASFGEAVVLPADHGAIASWSPTGLGVSTGHDILEKGAFLALFNNQLHSLGEATSQAKYYLASNTSANRELIDTYLLFGDPATDFIGNRKCLFNACQLFLPTITH